MGRIGGRLRSGRAPRGRSRNRGEPRGGWGHRLLHRAKHERVASLRAGASRDHRRDGGDDRRHEGATESRCGWTIPIPSR